MAYTGSNLSIKAQTIAGYKEFVYATTDAIATVNTTGYFSDGYARGMRVGDVVTVIDTATPTTTLCVVSDVNATTGVADIADGTSLTRTDSD